MLEKGNILMMTAEEHVRCDSFLRGPIYSQVQQDWARDNNHAMRWFLTVCQQYTVRPETERRWKGVLRRVDEDMTEMEQVRFIKGTFRCGRKKGTCVIMPRLVMWCVTNICACVIKG
jgi:hypothetical protein